MRSHAQLHVLNQEIPRANNFAAEEPPPASFTWLRNALRSVTRITLCDTTNHQPPTTNHHLPTPPSPNLSTLNHLYLFFLWLRHKKHRWKKYIEMLLNNKNVTQELRGRVAVISELKTSSDRELVQSFAGSCRTETLHNT